MAQSEIKVGARLRSASGGTEVIVVRAPAAHVVIECGGEPMEPVTAGAPPAVAPVSPAEGEAATLVGKRYADEELGLELLCTRSGSGSLTVDGAPVPMKGTKLLPSSD